MDKHTGFSIFTLFFTSFKFPTIHANFKDIQNHIKNATLDSEISDRSYGRIESLLLSSVQAYGCWCNFYDPELKDCFEKNYFITNENLINFLKKPTT